MHIPTYGLKMVSINEKSTVLNGDAQYRKCEFRWLNFSNKISSKFQTVIIKMNYEKNLICSHSTWLKLSSTKHFCVCQHLNVEITPVIPRQPTRPRTTSTDKISIKIVCSKSNTCLGTSYYGSKCSVKRCSQIGIYSLMSLG